MSHVPRHLLLERSADGHVLTVVMNRPEALNAMNTALGEDLLADTAMILAIEAYTATVVTEDRLEGVRAFNEKRKPEFKGR